MTRKELEKANGGNLYFASIAWSLYEDFADDDGNVRYNFTCSAEFRKQRNLFTGEEEVVLVISEDAHPYHRVTLSPSTSGHIPCVILTVSDGEDSIYSVCLYKEDIPEYRALEVARIVCVAAFHLVTEEE